MKRREFLKSCAYASVAANFPLSALSRDKESGIKEKELSVRYRQEYSVDRDEFIVCADVKTQDNWFHATLECDESEISESKDILHGVLQRHLSQAGIELA